MPGPSWSSSSDDAFRSRRSEDAGSGESRSAMTPAVDKAIAARSHGRHPDEYGRTMSEGPAEDRVSARAELLPEEVAVGSDDPELQARAILAESGDRTEHPERTRRESTQTPDEVP